MRRFMEIICFTVVLVCVLAGWALAQDQKKPGEAKQETAPEVVTTEHVLETPDGPLTYVARTGEMLVPANKDKPQARLFFVAYEKKGEDAGKRPVTFAFNGGPGSSSVWLHLGALGPKRIALGPDGTPPPPPVGYEDNQLSWLRFTDMVFIDPVGTGYSRSDKGDDQADGEKGSSGPGDKGFWGVKQDVASVAAFIRLFLTRQKRWLSPVYLVGESYGTTRAAMLSSYLVEEYGIAARGVMFISPVLDFTALQGSTSNLPYCLFLPSFAAAAVVNGKASPEKGQSLEQYLAQVEKFSVEHYLPALTLGADLDVFQPGGEEKLRKQLAAYTGLPERVVRQQQERIPPWVFFKELLRDKNRLIGRMDASTSVVDPEPGSPHAVLDPSLDGLMAPFSSAMNAYVRQELNYENDLPYEILNSEVGGKWDWSTGLEGKQGYVDVGEEARMAMSLVPDMRLFFGCGYYDVATPYFASIWTVRQMRLEPEQRKQVTIQFYEGGHMLYTHEDARKKLFEDAEAFYRGASQ